MCESAPEKILRELGHEKEIVKLYRECGDPRLKVQILFRLRESTAGLPNLQGQPHGQEDRQY